MSGTCRGAPEVPGDEREQGGAAVPGQADEAHAPQAIGSLQRAEHAFYAASHAADQGVAVFLAPGERMAALGTLLSAVADAGLRKART